MLEHITPTPENVLAVKASGTVTGSDYKTVLIPAFEKQAKAGKVRLVYEVGPECDGFDASAALNDAALGLGHWRDFEKVAIVTDRAWIAHAVHMLMPLFPAETKLFRIGQTRDAVAWAAA
jgi:hypothetical protein